MGFPLLPRSAAPLPLHQTPQEPGVPRVHTAAIWRLSRHSSISLNSTGLPEAAEIMGRRGALCFTVLFMLPPNECSAAKNPLGSHGRRQKVAGGGRKRVCVESKTPEPDRDPSCRTAERSVTRFPLRQWDVSSGTWSHCLSGQEAVVTCPAPSAQAA